MKKRAAALCAAAALCLFQIMPSEYTAYAADRSSAAVMSEITGSSAEDLRAGEKFYVDVSVSELSGCAFALNASWDINALELTGADANSDLYNRNTEPFTYVPFDRSSGTPEQALTDYQNGRTSDVCVFAFVSGDNIDCSGVAVTLEFTVKQGPKNGKSEINVYFDPENPPEYFGPGHESIVIDVSEGIDDEHDGKVYAEINDMPNPETYTDMTEENAGTNAEPPASEMEKSFSPDFEFLPDADDNSPFTTIIIAQDQMEYPDASAPENDSSNGSPEDIDEYDPGTHGYIDDVSAAAGTSDKAAENIRRIAAACTAVLAAGLIVLMSQKQKRKNNGSDRIK